MFHSGWGTSSSTRPSPPWWDTLDQYMQGNREAMKCPAYSGSYSNSYPQRLTPPDKGFGMMWSEHVHSYGLDIMTVKKPAERVATAEGNHAVNGWGWASLYNLTRLGPNHNNGVNTLFLDGHVEWHPYLWFSATPSDPRT